MDKIASYNIQMNLNLWSLNSGISDTRAFDTIVSKASDVGVSEALDSKVSEALSRGIGLGSALLEFEKRSWSLGLETFSGFWLSWALTWACGLFGLMKVDSWSNKVYRPTRWCDREQCFGANCTAWVVQTNFACVPSFFFSFVVMLV